MIYNIDDIPADQATLIRIHSLMDFGISSTLRTTLYERFLPGIIEFVDAEFEDIVNQQARATAPHEYEDCKSWYIAKISENREFLGMALDYIKEELRSYSQALQAKVATIVDNFILERTVKHPHLQESYKQLWMNGRDALWHQVQDFHDVKRKGWMLQLHADEIVSLYAIYCDERDSFKQKQIEECQKILKLQQYFAIALVDGIAENII